MILKILWWHIWCKNCIFYMCFAGKYQVLTKVSSIKCLSNGTHRPWSCKVQSPPQCFCLISQNYHYAIPVWMRYICCVIYLNIIVLHILLMNSFNDMLTLFYESVYIYIVFYVLNVFREYFVLSRIVYDQQKINI